MFGETRNDVHIEENVEIILTKCDQITCNSDDFRNFMSVTAKYLN